MILTGIGAAADAESSAPSVQDKLRFLSDVSAYAYHPASVSVVETHMSYVFLAGGRVYKLKKPVRYPFLDFSTIRAREHNCREEARLNDRLAAGVYLGVVPLTFDEAQGLAIGGDAPPVDWLVVMRRLPQEYMMDRLIRDGRLTEAQIDAISEKLSKFYRSVESSSITAKDYSARFFSEQDKNRDILMRRNFALDHGRIPILLDLLDATLTTNRSLLERRVHDGAVIEGHGDLRPEHICLCEPVAIFDCLEFNKELRQVDPFDELAFLGVECAQLGAGELGQILIDKCGRLLGEKPPRQLIALYSASRAMLRARLSVAHLLDPTPRQPEKWEPLASRYIDLAQRALTSDL